MATAEQIRAEREAARLQRNAEREARLAQQKAELKAGSPGPTLSPDQVLAFNKANSIPLVDGQGFDPFSSTGEMSFNTSGAGSPVTATNPRVSYSGKVLNVITPDSVGWANVGVQGGGGIQYSTQNSSEDDRPYLRYFAPNGLMPFLSEQNGVLGYNSGSEDDSEFTILRDTSGNPITRKSIGLDQPYGFSSYQVAKDTYSSGYVPWNIDNVYEGLSNRQPFNLNALWGGTQYAQGRVTDWSHLDPTQLQANVIASDTRNRLWNEYDRLTAQGSRPAKNPDEVALDFYVKNVGQNGNQFGYGPGVNTALLAEAITTQFLNSPDVIQARGISYKTPQWKMAEIDAFGTAHEAGVPIWQVFEKQGISSGGFGRFIPLIIGAIVFPGMGAALANALGGTIAANIAAGAIIGGVNAEINGGNFIDGAVKSALTAGAGAAIANTGIAAEVSSAIESVGIDANIANSVADTAERAITSAIVAEATGGDVSDAILNTLVAAGVSAARSEVADIADNLIAGEAPADIEDAEIGAAMTEAAIQPQETSIVAPQQQEVVASPAPQPEIVASQPIPAGPITPEEIISEIQPEPVTPEPIVTEEAVVPRETEVAAPQPEIVAETTPESVTPAPVEPAPEASVQDEIPIEAAPVEDVVEPEPVKPQQPEPFPPITEDDLLQALIDEEIIPEEAAVETESIFEAPEIAPEAPGEGQPAEKIPAKEVVVEPVVEEVPIFEEPLPIPETIPEVVPEVEPEVVPEVEPVVEPVVEPTEEDAISDQDLLQALVDEGLLPEEVLTPEEPTAEVAPETPQEVLPEEVLPEEVLPEEEVPIFEEPLPEEEPIPEAMPEVEPEPVLPEEGAVDEEVAPESEPITEEPAVSDQDVLDELVEEDAGEETMPEEDAGEETMPEEDTDEEVTPEEGEVLPEEETAKEPTEEEPETERQRTEAPSSIDKLIASLLLSDQGGRGNMASAPRRVITQESISPREISGSVTGIIGKKQPMFSSDEDEQSAEWNRRSLRLRKVLGL